MTKDALLVMDVQPGILKNVGTQAEEYLARIRKLVEAAHNVHMPVIFVVVRFREGYPEVSPQNKSFENLKKNVTDPFFEDRPAAQPAIPLEPGDILVAKRRVSAFSGSDLEVILRAGAIGHLTLCGISTSGVVLSTVREAADKDYILTVIEDACFDADQEVHKILTTKLFPKQASVVTSEEWIQTIPLAGAK
jgi:nicotinamidase-related amidase